MPLVSSFFEGCRPCSKWWRGNTYCNGLDKIASIRFADVKIEYRYHCSLQNNTNVGSNYNDLQNTSRCNILDPISSNRKGGPRKLRWKSLLESTSKNINIFFITTLLMYWEFEATLWFLLMNMQATSTSNKGKKSRARPSSTQDGASKVQASQLQQYSMLSSLSYSQHLLVSVLC